MERKNSDDAENEVQEYEKLYKSGQWSTLLKATDTPETPEQFYFRVLLTQGLAFQEIKQFDESLQCFKRVYQFRALFPDLEYNLGLAYFYKKDYEASVRHFENYLRIHPTNTSIYHETAMVLYLSNRLQDVLTLCQRAEEWRVKRPPYRYWVLSLLRLGEVAKAHQKALLALANDSESAGLWLALGDVLCKAGYEEEAKYAYSKARDRAKTGTGEMDEVNAKMLSSDISESRIDLGPDLLPSGTSVREKPRHSMCDLASCAVF